MSDTEVTPTEGQAQSEQQQETPAQTTDATVTLSKAELMELVSSAVAKEVSGLKAKNAEVISDNKKLKERLAKVPSVTDEDVKELQGFRRAKATDEIVDMITSGRREEAVNKLTAGIRSEHEAAMKAEREEAARIRAEAEAYRKQYTEARISAEIGQNSASIKPNYIRFIQQEVKDKIAFDEDTGQARVLGDDGKTIFDKTGRPVTVAEYIEGLRPKYPDFFVTSVGGGSTGSTKVANPKGRVYSYEEAQNLSVPEFRKAMQEGRIKR